MVPPEGEASSGELDLGSETSGAMDALTKGTLAEFQEAMKKTATKSRAQPFKSQFGWHILEVVDRRSRDITDENRKQLEIGRAHV